MFQFHSRKIRVSQMFLATVCFCGFACIFYYTLGQSTSFKLPSMPSVAVNGVVALTGFLSISQHQLNSKTSHSRNLHNIILANLSSRNPFSHSNDDSWEDLERYTLLKPTENKVRRKFKNEGEFDEKFLRNDERSIERIVNGLASDSQQIFAKQGKPKKRFPNAIIIGVKKGGTRALLEMLKIHPQVCSCGPEIHYFDRYFKRDLQWYRDRMPLCYENEIIIEKTPSYFVTNGVAKAIFEYSKHLNEILKLIVIVRDPTRRAISDYTQTQSNYYNPYRHRSGTPRTFEELALRHGDNGEAQVNSQWGAIKIGVYSKHLKRWLRYFKRTQIHVVSGESLIKEPYQELRKVEKFLQLPKFIKPEHFVYNKTKGFYCFDKGVSNNVSPNDTTLRCLGRTKGRTHVLVSNETEQLLRNFYRPFNEELYDLIGRNFGWA